ncbi:MULTISPECIES: ammonium transporter [Gibbsiella]|uniref:Ammonium transporter n=1 Tax=Gibbsiella dentisursi TaxID=796890 RepID=A0ABP7KQV1_9GAMM|nr:ammonium transporter [Gibbsiella quercinecans]
MKSVSLRWKVLAGACCLLFAQHAGAAVPTVVMSGADTAFVFTCSLAVLLMTLPGLALYYGGLAQTKNVLSVLMQVFSVAALMSLLFAIYGYSLAFSDGGGLQTFIGGIDKLFLRNITTDSLVGTLPEYLYVLFMMLFAAITPCLIAGSFAERIKFSAVMIFMAIWLTIDYIPLAHMAWGGGWILNWTDQDFAGGNVVHVNAGIAALIGALLIGPRRGFGHAILPPHNMTMTLTGGCLLWVGWFGFCGGCALAANGYSMLVVLNTMLASCAGAICWLLIEWKLQRKPSLLGAITGAIAGLVAITPACGYVGPMGAIALGFIISPICMYAVIRLKARMKLDDAFDVFAIHGIGGIVGGVLTPVFALPWLGGQGFIEGRSFIEQLGVNVASMLFCIVWAAVASGIAYKAAALLCGGLRVDDEQEIDGLDLSSHGEVGYRTVN